MINRFFKNIKYFYFFHRLLCNLFFFIVYKNLTLNSNKYLIQCINSDIKNNGFVTIKLIQWLLCRYRNLMIKTNRDNYIYNLLENFSNVYEDCNIHDFNYTEKIYNQDFSENLLEIIEIDNNYKINSASIAQVYKGIIKETGEVVAIKVCHPDLDYQFIYPYFYYRIYLYLSSNLKCFNKYVLPFDMSGFFNNFFKQIDMNNEYINLEYFYNEYINNPLVLIPKPIKSSKNILIMKYIEGENFESFKDSQYMQNKFILLVNLFVRNNIINLEKVHGDLHSNNWKIVIEDNKEKIVIYDFGFCVDVPKNSKHIINDLSIAMECNEHKLFANCIYNYLKTPCRRSIFLKDSQTFIDLNSNNISINSYIDFCINKGYRFNSDILDLILSSLLVNNYFSKYIANRNMLEDLKNVSNDKIYILEDTNKHILGLLTLCEINNCYDNLKDYLKKFMDRNIEKIREIKHNNILDQKNIIKSINNDTDFIDL